jgi:hypothetical protein
MPCLPGFPVTGSRRRTSRSAHTAAVPAQDSHLFPLLSSAGIPTALPQNIIYYNNTYPDKVNQNSKKEHQNDALLFH